MNTLLLVYASVACFVLAILMGIDVFRMERRYSSLLCVVLTWAFLFIGGCIFGYVLTKG